MVVVRRRPSLHDFHLQPGQINTVVVVFEEPVVLARFAAGFNVEGTQFHVQFRVFVKRPVVVAGDFGGDLAMFFFWREEKKKNKKKKKVPQ